MKKFIEKHINKILLVSIIINCIAVFVVGKLYYEKETKHFVYNPNGSIVNYDSVFSPAIITRTNIINSFADKFKCKSYLEIGQGIAKDNFNWINCKHKIGVDPDSSLDALYKITSDEFFKQNKETYDLIFIDGLHENEQVYRDIINSLNCLNKNGSIIIHDCNPTTEAMQIVPRIQDSWTGDVWKAWVRLRSERNDLEMFVVDANFGCGIIRVGKQNAIQLPDSLNYQYFSEHKNELLNLKSVNDLLSYLKME